MKVSNNNRQQFTTTTTTTSRLLTIIGRSYYYYYCYCTLLFLLLLTASSSNSIDEYYYKPYLGHIHQRKARRLLQTRPANNKEVPEQQNNNNNKRTSTSYNNYYQKSKNARTTTNDKPLLFTPAQPLEYYTSDKIDPTKFEWFNPDHVMAGGQTCGYLYPPLGHDAAESYPTIQVKFCMRFADIQPASKGNLVVHCGGPGSLSSCGLAYTLGRNNQEHYNIITLDQRGMGVSRPSFAHPECTYGTKLDEYGDLVLTGMSSDYIDATNATTTQFWLDQQKERIAACWSCETCGFQLQNDAGDKTFHFLEHSGTRQAAEDIEMFRKVVLGKDTPLSLYGVSYGTQIMATYATMFSQHVDKFVIDSSMPANPDLYDFASIIAENIHQRTTYLAYTCEIRNFTNAGSCNINLNDCYQSVFNQYEQIFGTIGYMDFERIFFAEFTQESVLNNFKTICDAASSQNQKTFLNALVQMEAKQFQDPIIESCLPGIYNMAVDLLETVGSPHVFYNENKSNKQVPYSAYVLAFLVDYDTCQQFVQSDNNLQQSLQEELVYGLWQREYGPFYYSRENNDDNEQHNRKLTDADCTGPTYAHGLYPFLVKTCLDGSITTAENVEEAAPIEDYSVLMGEPAVVPQTMVLGQSMAGSTYDDQHVIQEIQDIYRKYGGDYYGEETASNFIFWYTLGFYWPKAQPVPPAGDTRITGIVSGQLYDKITAYKFTQEMKRAFPSTTLITSQWTMHGFSSTKATHHGDILSDMGDENLEGSCQPLINRYFELGYVDVVDGYVCQSILPDTFTDF